MIKKKRPERSIEINLDGPQGNVFNLMGIAQRLAKELDRDGDAIIADMKSSNYEHAVEVLEREFGDYIVMYRDSEDEDGDDWLEDEDE